MTDKPTTYEALAFNRGIVVFEMPSRNVEAENFNTLEDARRFADVMNRWVEGKPTPATMHNNTALTYNPFYRDVRREPHAAELIELLDRLFDPEDKLDLLQGSIAAEFDHIKRELQTVSSAGTAGTAAKQ